MASNKAGAVTVVNRALARAGRSERVVRGRGYWYLAGGEAHTWQEAGLYSLGANMAPGVEHLASAVRAKYDDAGIAVELPGL